MNVTKELSTLARVSSIELCLLTVLFIHSVAYSTMVTSWIEKTWTYPVRHSCSRFVALDYL